MSKTYRIRTEVGVDRQVNIELEQDFDQLEILSLKVRSEDVYTRMCADYGVIVGRVLANGGYGVPNVKVSVFIPITDDDLNNEIIYDLYPYRSLNDVNADGYRYNLLPYEQQHTGHIPTGTFPSKNDILTNPALIEVYDKYYKFTVKTNGSGDYMIMGVPIGTYTVVMDLDLSDIGPFSLSPQDLIRMGRATADQFDGVNFKSSTNLFELPQIVTLNQSVNVQPFWGQPEICQIDITRTDFDLRQSGINISPTAMFMGSLITNSKDYAIPKNCKPPQDLGSLCSLETAPGEIIGVRQTIFQDTQGRPILEQAQFPQGAKTIDSDGTWLLEVPMNLDYVTTNEFGEQVLSPDPKIGIPTRGKYRFKIKYSQPANFAKDEVRRAYYLVPNIKEYGWGTANPYDDPIYKPDSNTGYQELIGSYYFGLDWSGYTNAQDAIDCKDTFYEFQYNKVYTVSQLIDEYKKGTNRKKFIGIKEITNTECESENNRFPATDGLRQNFSIIPTLVTFLLYISSLTTLVLLPIVHVLALIWPIISVLLKVVFGTILTIVSVICKAVNKLRGADNQINCPKPYNFQNLFKELTNPFSKITLPNLTYPECQFCECKQEPVPQDNDELTAIQEAAAQNSLSLNADFFVYDNWNPNQSNVTEHQEVFAGKGFNSESIRVPIRKNDNNDFDFIDKLPPWEIINKYNLKSKYFDTDPYAGSNRIKVQVEPKYNSNTNHFDNIMAVFVDPDVQGTFISGQLLSFQEFTKSTDPNTSGATSTSETGITGTTNAGKSVTMTFANPTSPDLSNSSVTYNFPTVPNETKSYKFPTDIEYFQVITGVTYNDFVSQNAAYAKGTTTCNYLNYTVTNQTKNPITINYTDYNGTSQTATIGVFVDIDTNTTYGATEDICACENSLSSTKKFSIDDINSCSVPAPAGSVLPGNLLSQLTQQIELFKNDGKDGHDFYNSYIGQWIGGEISLVFMVRGVDPHSGRKSIKYDLSRIFGYSSYGKKVISGDFYMNVPVQQGLKTVRNNELTSNLQSNSNGYLYFNSFQYTAGTQYSAYTTTLQNYYSSLDLDRVGNYKINPDNNDSLLTSAMVYNGGSGQLVANSSTEGYIQGEYIEGGSFIWAEKAKGLSKIKKDKNGNDNNNTRPWLYFAPSYGNYGLGKMVVYNQKMVMRSDRLPVGTIFDGSANNYFAWQASNALPYIFVDDDGTANTQLVVPSFDFSDPTSNPDLVTGATFNAIANSFTCNGMVDLSCYQGDGRNFTALPATNECNTNTNKGDKVVAKGCYVLVNKPITTLFGRNNDFSLIIEWVGRLRLMIAVCQGTFSHTFVNSWINGTLFAFPFQNAVRFNAKNEPIVRTVVLNKAFYNFCADTIVYEPQSNNFYYRSSPWDGQNFIGQYPPSGLFNSPVNDRNLLYPTTIMDLGPKFIWSKDVNKSPNYFGYQMDRFNATSWNNVSDLLQLFIISRLSNSNLLQSTKAGVDTSISAFFSRPQLRVDGDYAQMLQINSQYGIVPYTADNYFDDPATTTDNVVYVSVDKNNNSVFGIFYSGYTEERDLISPRRIDRTFTGNTLIADYLGTKSQEVPFYRWSNTAYNVGQPSIFGSEANNWYTEGNAYKEKYQNLDRMLNPMFIGGNNQIQNRKGYIYQTNSLGQYSPSPALGNNNNTITSAPWYFYFGLKKGSSAMDKFTKLYIKSEE